MLKPGKRISISGIQIHPCDYLLATCRPTPDVCSTGYVSPASTGTDILVSWHSFKHTPNISVMQKKLSEMKKFSKNVKMVTMAKTISDGSRILSLYKNSKGVKLIAFSMGNFGRMSRLLCLLLGSPYTYVSLGKAVAPGQFSVDEVKSIFTMRK